MSKEFDLSNIKFPTRYVSSASVAKNIVDGVCISHEKYWDMIAKMEEHLDGKKPKDQEKLKKAGLAWSNNHNYGKARAKIEKGVSENSKAVSDALTLSSVSFRRYDPNKDTTAATQFLQSEEMRGVVSTKISQVFVDTVEREQRFTDFISTIEYTAYSFGWCAVTKDKKRDWFGTPHRIRDIGFKDKTKPDDIKTYVVFDDMLGEEVWRVWLESKKSENIFKKSFDNEECHTTPKGWVIEGMEEVLYHCYNGIDETARKDTHYSNFEEIIPDFVRSPNLVSQNTDKVKIARIYNFEMDSDSFTVTYIAYKNEWYVDREGKKAVKRSGSENILFCPKYLLYQKTYKGLDQDDVITIIKESGFSTSGYIQDLRGIAKFAIEDSIRFNRKKNQIEDKLIFSGSPVFNQQTGQDGHAFRIAPSQGFILTSENFRMADKQPSFDLSNHLLSINMDEAHYERETLQYDAKIGSGLTSRPNKDEVRIKSQEIAKLAGSKMEIKIRCYRRLFFNMLKSLSDLVKKGKEDISNLAVSGVEYFKEELLYELKEFGVEDEKDLYEVLSAINDLSLEIVSGDAEFIKEMLSLAETPYARRRLVRMLAISKGLSRGELNKLFPVLTDDYKSLGGKRVAAIENDLFWTTKEVVYQDNDDPIEHLDIHYNKIATVFEQIGNVVIDPVKGYQYIANLLEHSIFHLEKMVSNPFFFRYFKEYKGIYDGFTKALNSLKGQIEKMAKQIAQNSQQQGQQQEQIDPKTKAKIEMDWFKAKASAQLNKERSDFRAKEKAKEAEFRRRMQAEDHEIKRRQAEEMAQLEKERELMLTSIRVGEALTRQQQ